MNGAPYEEDRDARMTLIVVLLAFAYVAFALPILAVASASSTPGRWMALVPVAQLLVLCRAAQRSTAGCCLLVVPLAGEVYLGFLWSKIALRVGLRSGWGWTVGVPVLGLATAAAISMYALRDSNTRAQQHL